MPPPSPHILDVTIRDGSYLINHHYTPQKVAEITRALCEAGVQFAEVSHGMGIGSKLMGFPAYADDEDLLEAAKTAAPNLKISVFISVSDFAASYLPALLDYFDLGRVGVNIHQVTTAEKIIKRLKKHHKKISLQLVRSHGRPPEFAAKAAKTAESMGADIVYVVDSFGSFLPKDAADYVAAVKSAIKGEVGFHGHNHIGMAIPNTLAAWEAGASWLDASLMGVGRGAGNANLEILAQLLQEKGQCDYLNVARLCDTTQKIVFPLFQTPPVSKLTDLLLSQERMDYAPDEILELLSGILQIPLEEFLTRLHSKMGDELTLGEPHFKAVLKDAGVDYDQLGKAMKPPEERK